MKIYHPTLSNAQPVVNHQGKVFRTFGEKHHPSAISHPPVKAIVLLLLIMFFVSLRGLATTYYTAANGTPSATANWWSNTDGTGSHPTNFASATDIFEIQSGHNMTTTVNWTVAGTVKVDAGGILTIASADVMSFGAFSVSGTVVNQSTGAHSFGTMTVDAGGIYEHAINDGVIPSATWNASSTCKVTGIVGNDISNGDAQNFGNLIWNCTGQSTDHTHSAALNIQGNLEIISTGSKNFKFDNDQSNTIGGNYIQSGGSVQFGNNNLHTLSVTGNFTLSGGTFDITGNGSGVSTVTVGGDFSVSGTSTYDNSSGATSTLNLSGNYAVTSGATFTESGAGNTLVNFNGSATHVFTAGGSITNHIDFAVNSPSVLSMGTSIIPNTSTGTFDLYSGAGIITAHANGITVSTASGSIQVTGTRTYSTGADYTYNGTVNQADGDGLPTTVRNLTINNTGASGNNTFTLNHSTTVTQNLTVTSGILSEASNVGIHTNGNVSIASAGTLLAGSGTHNAGGNWTNNGTFTANTSTVIFDGSTAQAIGGSSPTTYNNVTFSGGGKKTLSVSQTVNGLATFTNGIVVSTASAPLVFSSTGTVTGASDNSFVSGPVTKSGTAAFVFPIGKDTTSFTHYQALGMGSASGSNTFTVEYFRSNNAFMDRPKQSPVVAVSMCEYWNIDRSSGSSAVDITLYGNTNSGCGSYTGTTYFNGTSLNDLRVVHWNGTEWTDANTGTNSVSGTSPDITVTAQGVNTFSPFSFGSVGSNPLPVKLIQFSGKINEGNVLLQWSTASERNNDHFDVERSMDGKQFIKVGEVAGAGNSTSIRYYSFTDPVAEQQPQGNVYYRLKQVDMNQTAEYSSVINVQFVKAGSVSITSVAPNPFNDHITVQFNSGLPGSVVVRLINLQGVEVDHTTAQAVRGDNTVSFRTDDIAQGMYLLRIENGNQAVTQKVLIKN